MSDPLTILVGGSDLIVDALGPDPIVVMVAGSLLVDVPDDPLEIDFAAVGMPGRDGVGADDIGAVAAADLAAGTPVAIDRSTARFIAADAAWKPAAFVAGLLRADVGLGFIGTAATAQLILADWSAVTGTANLSPGVAYFLAVGGGLTTVPPTTGCVVMVGKALDSRTLLIAPQPPTLL